MPLVTLMSMLAGCTSSARESANEAPMIRMVDTAPRAETTHSGAGRVAARRAAAGALR